MLQNFTLGSFAQGVSAGGGAFESIASANGTGSSGTITFSSIPGTYQSLHFRIRARSDWAGGATDVVKVVVNSDTGTNYVNHWLRGDGAAVSATFYTGLNELRFIRGAAAGTAAANIVAVDVMDIHDYASTTRNKTFRWFGGQDNNGSGDVALISGLWISTSAITSISFSPINGTNWTTATQISLYGIKGA
jgi:hypothetical protein